MEKQSKHFDHDNFRQAFSDRYAEFQLHWSIFFAAHLFNVRKFFGNLEDPQILCALGIGPLAKQAGSGRVSGGSEVATSAMSLAEMTGIPRQTVRRRLRAMESLGWVYQAEDHGWHIALADDGFARVRADVRKIHPHLVDDLAQLLLRFQDLLSQHRPGDTPFRDGQHAARARSEPGLRGERVASARPQRRAYG